MSNGGGVGRGSSCPQVWGAVCMLMFRQGLFGTSKNISKTYECRTVRTAFYPRRAGAAPRPTPHTTPRPRVPASGVRERRRRHMYRSFRTPVVSPPSMLYPNYHIPCHSTMP